MKIFFIIIVFPILLFANVSDSDVSQLAPNKPSDQPVVQKYSINVKGRVLDKTGNVCPRATISYISSSFSSYDPNSPVCESGIDGKYEIAYEEKGIESVFPLYCLVKSADLKSSVIAKLDASDINKDVVLFPDNHICKCKVISLQIPIDELRVTAEALYDEQSLKKAMQAEVFLSQQTLNKNSETIFSNLPSANMLMVSVEHGDTRLKRVFITREMIDKQKISKLEIKLPEFRKPIIGKVLDSNQKPVAGLLVRINNSENGDWVCGVFSDKNGEFNTGWLPLDTLNFTVMQDINGVSCIATGTLAPDDRNITLVLKNTEDYFREL